MEELLKKQKQEKKELQANIQKMKQLVPKNDKKRRKEMTQKIEEMESELKERHENEMKQFNQTDNQSNDKPILEQLEQLQISLESNQMNFESSEQSQKASKAQKRRERKEREQLEKEKRMAQDEKDNVNHIRNIEINKLNKLFEDHNLKLYDIPSNGDCMYKAIEHQLSLNGINEYNVNGLRKLTSNSLRENKDHYLSFMTTDDGELMTDEKFEKYCSDVEQTNKWGGNVELQVLSESIRVNIDVYQSDGPIIKFKSSKDPVVDRPLLISYHKYLYQLGGHYNSLLRTN